MMKKSLNLILVLVLVFGTLSCKSQKKSESNSKSAQVFDVLYLKRTGCMGKCPVYEVWFKSDLKMVYKGQRNMTLVGDHVFVIPAQLTKNLVFEAKKAGIQKLDNQYPYAPDLPGVELHVVIDGKKKVIKSEGMTPQVLQDYVKLVHQEVAAMIYEQQPVPEEK